VSRVRLVATDLDGTLLDSTGHLSARSAAAVRAVRDAGIHVVPVTARPPQATWPFIDAARMGPLGVCSNGAVVVDAERRVVLEVEEVKDAALVVDTVREAIPGCVLASDGLDCFTHEPGFFELPVDWDEVIVEVADLRAVAAKRCIALVARSPGSGAGELAAVLAEALDGVAQVTTAGESWVFITSPAATKVHGLARACQRLGIGPEEVLAVGDNHNDLGFLAWAGIAMAPANAVPDARALASRVLEANDADGVAVLLEALAQGDPCQVPNSSPG
jgi:HAD superfamily hydrolase (TIGR01484 family)